MVSARKVKYIATIKAIPAATRQNQARSVDRKPVWPFAMSGSESQLSPTITTQTIPVMKALKTDAFLVVINGQGTIVVKHSEWFAANDVVPAR